MTYNILKHLGGSKMKKSLLILTLVSSIASYGAEFSNGLYRGVFVSGQETQVEVQFNLKDDIVSNPKYRTLTYKGTDYLKEKSVADQKERYETILKFTDRKKFKEVLEKLYKPEEIEVAGASVRGTKIRAAMQNAVNSGVYKPE